MSKTELTTIAEKAGDELQIHYVPLDAISNHFLEGNSKRHDIGTLAQSVDRYSFRDPIAFDRTLNNGKGGIVEGNGRLELLCQLKEQGQDPPKGIKTKGDQWFIPCVFGVDADSEAEAIAYSVSHNLSPLWGGEFTFLDSIKLFDESLLESQLTGLAEFDALPVGIDGSDVDLWLSGGDLAESDDSDGSSGDPPIAPDDYQSKYGVLIECDDAAHQEDVYNKLAEDGYTCKILTV